jgi:hypothetical protein
VPLSTCAYRDKALDLLSTVTHLETSAVPPGRGPIRTCYVTEASLGGHTEVQVGRGLDQSHRRISGMLLFTSDEYLESLGQVGWEYSLTPDISVPLHV